MRAKGERFKSLREHHQIKQKQMADFLGVDQSLISKFENNERLLNIELLEKSADLFGCSVMEFFKENEDTSLRIAFRAESINEIDFEAIAKLNRIAMNLMLMEKIEAGR